MALSSKVAFAVAALPFWAAGTGPDCSSCHADIVKHFALSGMARSVSPVERTGAPPVQRLGGVEKTLAFAIGSGHAARTFVWRLEDALFQAPLSWYTDRRQWDLSPGYERDPNPTFYRPIEAECLTCHANRSLAVPGSSNRYAFSGAPEPIGCERCHGPGEAHAKQPQAGNIVNPARLSPDRRDSVCESCHLGGEARIPNPGRSFEDFVPGMLLEEAFSVYVSGDADGRVTGHAEQMAASRCASAKQLWCGSCHDPHQKPEPARRASFFRDRCVQCHADSGKHEQARGPDCAGCHMPRSQSYDGGHTAFTDHRIRLDRSKSSTRGDLRPWRPGRDDARGLALAYLTVSLKKNSLPDLQQAVRRLNEVLAGDADDAVYTAAGLLALRQDKPALAVQWLTRALKGSPQSSVAHSNLAAALLANGARKQAIEHAKQAIALEPLLEAPYGILASADPERAGYWIDSYKRRAQR